MPNYQEGKIYTVRNYADNEMIYVGSTTRTLSQRLAKHRNNYNGGKNRISLYSHIVDNDWSNWYIELYEYYPCNNKSELCKREGQVIREIGTINKYIAGRTQKEWSEDNADKLKDKKKIYCLKNADKIKEYKKNWHEENADKTKEKKKIQICCDICGTLLTKQCLARHQKTTKCTSAIK